MKHPVLVKIAGVMTAVSTVLASSAIPAMAANSEYNTDGEQVVPIIATIPSTYSVSIPASIQLSDEDSDGSYDAAFQVGAKGALAKYEGIFIIPDGVESLVVRGGGDSVPVTFNQSSHYWGTAGDKTINKNDYTMDDCSASVNLGGKIGNFSGAVTYRFGKTMCLNDSMAASTYGGRDGCEYTGAEVISMIEENNAKKNIAFYVYTSSDPRDRIWCVNEVYNGTYRQYDSSQKELALTVVRDAVDPADIYVLNEYGNNSEVDGVDSKVQGVSFVKSAVWEELFNGPTP